MGSHACSALVLLWMHSVSGVLAPAPCGTLNEICGADQYCDAGLSCQHCSGICRAGVTETRRSENLDYACNKYCPDYLLHSTTTEVRDSTVHTETVRLSTDTVLPVDKQELDPQVSGTRSQDNKASPQTVLLIILVTLVVIGGIGFASYRLFLKFKTRHNNQNDFELQPLRNLGENPPPDNMQNINQLQPNQAVEAQPHIINMIPAQQNAAPAPNINPPQVHAAQACNSNQQNVTGVATNVKNPPPQHAVTSAPRGADTRSEQGDLPVQPVQHIHSVPDYCDKVTTEEQNRRVVELSQQQSPQQQHSEPQADTREAVGHSASERGGCSSVGTSQNVGDIGATGGAEASGGEDTTIKDTVQTRLDSRQSGQIVYLTKSKNNNNPYASSGYYTAAGNIVCPPDDQQTT